MMNLIAPKWCLTCTYFKQNKNFKRSFCIHYDYNESKTKQKLIICRGINSFPDILLGISKWFFFYTEKMYKICFRASLKGKL